MFKRSVVTITQKSKSYKYAIVIKVNANNFGHRKYENSVIVYKIALKVRISACHRFFKLI